MMKKWLPFFSHTGSEICNIIEKTGMKPCAIITNSNNVDKIDPRVFQHEVYFLPNKPLIDDYITLFKEFGTRDDLLITLHGFMKIIPPEVLAEYDMINLHPGLITKYPELKGCDPQRAAVQLKLETSGVVIHKVTSEIDSGELEVVSDEVNIKDLSLSEVVHKLKDVSLECWIKFFKERGY